MHCPDCGNGDITKMTSAASGKRVYCLICHFSWFNALKTPEAHSTGFRKVYSPGDYKFMKTMIENLEKQLSETEAKLTNALNTLRKHNLQ